MNLECNIFKNVYDDDCSNVFEIIKILHGIRDGRWKDQIMSVREARDLKDKEKVKYRKFNLPAATFSGVFSERVDDACIVYNRLMVIDIDNISEKRVESLKIQLKKNPWVYCFFDGPTKGLKILVFVDSEPKDHNTHAFEFLEREFKTLYGIEIDKSGKNMSRLCFVSYDPEMYINDNPMAVHVEKISPALDGFVTIKKADYEKDKIPSTDGKYVFELSVKMVRKSKVGSYHKGNRNNFIFSLCCLLCEFGMDPELAITFVFERYRSLGYKEVKNTLESAYRRNRRKFGTKTAGERNNNDQITIF